MRSRGAENRSSQQSSSRRPPQRQHASDQDKGTDDPFLILAGTDCGNFYRRKRAIIQLEQMDMAQNAQIRELKLENSKLRTKLKRLREQADQTSRIESRFEQLSSIIMDGQIMRRPAEEEEEV
jgi:hypothetical protein